VNGETHIGQYKIVRTLGAGGMGTVYLGEHLLLGRRAAIKTLLPALSIHREIVDRFFNEARAISAITDPGVVQIFDFGYHVDGTAYIVMELLEGENLGTRLDRLGKLSLVESLRIGRMIASSLYAAHERGIIHRDLKPGNVFVIRDNDAPGGERSKILDFGICKLQNNQDASTTQTGVMLGTPVYMSPEQCRGSSDVDARSDLYSVGCVLFHMLTGRTPFDCESIGEFIACHLKEDPQAPSELEPSLPPSVDALVLRCLAKNPEDRFQTMRDLQGAIDDILATLSDPGRLPTPTHMNATPLAEGFQSGFDVNRASSKSMSTVSARPSRPSHGWFVDSQVPVGAAPIDENEGEHAWVKPDRGMSLAARAIMVLVLFVGIIGGIAATSAFMSDNDDRAAAAASTAPTTPGDEAALPVPPTHPAIAAPRDTAPVQPVATGGDGIEPELGTDDPAKTPSSTPAEAPAVGRDVGKDVAKNVPEPTTQVELPKKVDRPAPIRKWRPQPRRHVEPEQPEAKPEEDLYDTR
jgi:serine/threonine protein kinase